MRKYKTPFNVSVVVNGKKRNLFFLFTGVHDGKQRVGKRMNCNRYVTSSVVCSCKSRTLIPVLNVHGQYYKRELQEHYDMKGTSYGI